MSSAKTRRLGASGSVLLVVATLAAGVALTILGCVQGAGEFPGRVVVGKPADNSECLVCHLDFKEEPLTATHRKVGVSCVSCHGESLAHGDDEINIVTPDVVYGRAEIDAFCKKCHQKHPKTPAYAAFFKKWDSRRRPNGRFVMADSACTDCHGMHSIIPPDKQVYMEPE